jgi:hypothetical protein
MKKHISSELVREFKARTKNEPAFGSVSNIKIEHGKPREIVNGYQSGQVVITTTTGYICEIGLHEFPHAENLLGWVAHLALKPWIAKADLWTFIQIIAELKGFNLEPLVFQTG